MLHSWEICFIPLPTPSYRYRAAVVTRNVAQFIASEQALTSSRLRIFFKILKFFLLRFIKFHPHPAVHNRKVSDLATSVGISNLVLRAYVPLDQKNRNQEFLVPVWLCKDYARVPKILDEMNKFSTANQIWLSFLAGFQSSPEVSIPVADQKDCDLWGSQY